jgi:hypothetical protein
VVERPVEEGTTSDANSQNPFSLLQPSLQPNQDDEDHIDDPPFPASWRPSFSRSNSAISISVHPNDPPAPQPDAQASLSRAVPILNSIMLFFFFWSSASRPVARHVEEEEDVPVYDFASPASVDASTISEDEDERNTAIEGVDLPGSWRRRTHDLD